MIENHPHLVGASSGLAPMSLSRRRLIVNGLRGTAALSVLGGLGMSMAACGSENQRSSGDTISPGGLLLAGVGSDPDSLDPHKSSLAVSAVIYAGIFNRLVELEEDGSFEPSLATSWEVPDPTTYVFTLRDDVAFHNGEKFTAEDVVFTFHRLIDEEVGATYAGDFAALESVEATGENEVTFTLAWAFAPFLANVANRGHILNEKAVTSSDPTQTPVGTGPFLFDTWVQGRELTLVKNDDYFLADRPFLDGVTFRPRPNDQSRVLALRSNELGWLDGIPPQSVASVEEDPQLNYISSSTTGKPEFVFLNTASELMSNTALRQAICWAIDREEIASSGFFGAVEPGSIEVGRNSAWFGEGDDPYASGPDPQRVRSLLAEAGYPDGGITLNFPAWTSGPDAVRTAQIIQQQLKPYNIDIDIETVEISVWINRLFAGEFDITLAFQEQIVDPDNFWSLFFLSDATQNFTGYASEEADALIAEAAAAADPEERKRLYGEVRRTVLTDAPILFTAYLPLNYATRGEVIGAAISPIQDPRFVNVGLA